MNQIAEALIKGENEDDDPDFGSKPASTSINHVQAMLSKAWVKYTHDHSEVIGTSNVEKHLSRRAQLSRPVYTSGNEQVFNISPKESGHSADFKFRYHSPQEVMNRQFCIEEMTQAE
ncbi:hypothetical protein KEM54_000185 [Ascosphaera aggregata]|nr:hypothetical protein KEM54_000185 [Ascosphaera aggregata]